MPILRPEDLKKWRDRNRLTQQQAADALDISRRTFIAYEAGDSDIPRPIDLACRWLDKHPLDIELKDRFRLSLREGGTAGTTEVAIAALTMLQTTLKVLREKEIITAEMLHEICNDAITVHNESPAGDNQWTEGTVGLIRGVYHDIAPSLPPNDQAK